MTAYGRIEDHIAARIASDPDRLCCRFEGASLTRAQFGALTEACRASLEASGFKEGYRLATLLPNSPLMLALSTAVWQLGGAVVPLSHLAGEKMTLGAVQLADPFAVVATAGVKELEPLMEKLNGMGYPAAAVSPVQPLPVIRGRECSAEDRSMAVIFATSGTTGLPKAVPLTHQNLLSNILDTASHVGLEIDQPHSVLNMLPNFHTFGFCLSGTLPLILGYNQVVLPSFMPPSRALEALYKENVTVLIAVPTIIAMLCEAISKGPNTPPPGLKMAVCGGAPANERIYRRCKECLGVDLHEGYGLTECSPVVAAVHRSSDGRPGFIGPMLESFQWQLRNSDGEVLEGDEGVLWLQGPSVAQSYFRSPETTQSRFDGPWFNTGDVVRIHSDGFIQILDRMSDIIISGGFNVYPQEVENCLNSHPAVMESAVVGSPNAVSGEVVKAFVVTLPGAPVPTERELLNYCKDHLGYYKRPRSVEFVAELPRSPIGKVLRRTLRDLERQRHSQKGQ